MQWAKMEVVVIIDRYKVGKVGKFDKLAKPDMTRYMTRYMQTWFLLCFILSICETVLFDLRNLFLKEESFDQIVFEPGARSATSRRSRRRSSPSQSARDPLSTT